MTYVIRHIAMLVFIVVILSMHTRRANIPRSQTPSVNGCRMTNASFQPQPVSVTFGAWTLSHVVFRVIAHRSCVSNLRNLLVRERSALADPYCHLAWMSVCVFVRNFEVKYLGNERS